MQTLAFYDMVASALADKIRNSDTSTKDSYKEALNNAKHALRNIITRFRDIDPIMVPLLLNDEDTIEDITLFIDGIKKNAEKRKGLGLVFTGACFSKVVQRLRMDFPKYIDYTQNPHILIKPYEDKGWEDFASKMMKQIVLGSLLSLPKGDLRVNFINPAFSSKANIFTSQLPSDICKVYIDHKEILAFMDSLTNRIKETIKTGSNTQTPLYELVVLLEYPYKFDGLTDNLRIIIEQGKQSGIHFVVLNNLQYNFEQTHSFDILELKDNYFQEFGAFNNANEKDYDETLFRTYQIGDHPELLESCFNYLNDEMTGKEIILNTFTEEPEYATIQDGLYVPIGKPINKKEMEFCLGKDGHVHSFIIGQSGSGKSVLLHDIITEAIHKYSPEDLQLYLLDCKLGGVELNRYKNIKHTRALLVDNSDLQIILEILRDLNYQMQERGKTLRENGVQKIEEYNLNRNNNKMPHIWVVIDECHVLFEQHSSNERRARTEIIEILTKVATEGRNQGVHLIMATQTLANADIPPAILNNITDRYVLVCSIMDAEKMWPNCSKLTGELKVGDVLYHNTTNITPDTQFHSTYHTPEDLEEIIERAEEKAVSHTSNGQFYFNGSQIFCFDNDIINTVSKIKKHCLKASIGKRIDLKHEPVVLTLEPEMSENILITGIDEHEQSSRTAIDILFSLVASNKNNDLDYKFYILDFKNNEDSEYRNSLELMEQAGFITIVHRREIGDLLKQLTDKIKNNNTEPSILFIMGQHGFRELKLDKELETEVPKTDMTFGNVGFIDPSPRNIKTYKDAIKYILDNGPYSNIHTVLQVDKLTNLLFEDHVSAKYIFQKFRHLVLLRSDDRVSSTLGLPDEIRLENLNSDIERLRAIYYADGDEGWNLFSPFAIPKNETISLLTK